MQYGWVDPRIKPPMMKASLPDRGRTEPVPPEPHRFVTDVDARSNRISSTCRSDSGKRIYIITTRRITSGELLKLRKGLRIAGGEGSSPGGSSQFTLTMPIPDLWPRRSISSVTSSGVAASVVRPGKLPAFYLNLYRRQAPQCPLLEAILCAVQDRRRYETIVPNRLAL